MTVADALEECRRNGCGPSTECERAARGSNKSPACLRCGAVPRLIRQGINCAEWQECECYEPAQQD